MEQMQKMNDYCNQDVEVLEQVFLKLWPHCEMGLPNVNTLMRNDRTIVGCDKCGSLDNVKNGRYIKNVLIYQRYMCKDCGAQFLSRSAIKQGE